MIANDKAERADDLFEKGGGKTDETSKTDAVTNAVFFSAVFGELPDEAKPVYVSFKEKPSAGADWTAYPWTSSAEGLPKTHNNYFSLSTFKPDEYGRYQRVKAKSDAIYAIVLDDVGTKVPFERITAAASWKLETSPDNFQVGFILERPIKGSKEALRFMQEVIAAGLSDPGASDPATRLMRLPIGSNTKYNPVFQCKLIEWNPECRWDVEDLAKSLQIGTGRSSSNTSDKPHKSHADGVSAIYTPRPKENTVVTSLVQRGLYKRPLGDGCHEVTCPWVEEHTGGLDGGSAYFEPNSSYPIGGFNCFHGHCAKRNIHDLLVFLGIDQFEARMKGIIRMSAGDIHHIVDAAEQELAKTGKYYQRSKMIVTVNIDPGSREASVQEVSQHALVSALSDAATWLKHSLKENQWLRIDPPVRHVNGLWGADNFSHLPPLQEIARQPYLRLSEGTIATQPGFDPESGFYGVFETSDFNIPEMPTRQDAEASLALLKSLLAEFTFAHETDCAAALVAMLTAAVRPSLPLAPMFHVKAPTMGSGKTFLCQLIAAFATGQISSPMTFPREEEECRKALFAALLRNPAVITFDNLTSDIIPHRSLCAIMTTPHFQDRILTVSKMGTVSTRALFLSSGNNVVPVGDMTRRCVVINIDPQCETPAARLFSRPNLLQEVLQERGKYVSAALTIIRTWIVAGKPRTASKELGGYTVWSDICRQPILWLGLPDPVEKVFEGMVEDQTELQRLLNAWWGCFENSSKMLRDVTRYLADNYQDEAVLELKEVLAEIAGEKGGVLNNRKLGWWLKRNENKIVDNMRIVRERGSRSAEVWRVVKKE